MFADADLLIYFNDAQRWAWPLLPDRIFNSNSRGATTHTVKSPVANDKVQALSRDATCMRTLSMSYTTAATGTTKNGPVIWLSSRDEIYDKMVDATNWSAGVSDCYAAPENDQIYVGPVYAGDVFMERFVKFPTAQTATTSTCDLPDDYIHILETETVARALDQVGSPIAAKWHADAEKYILAIYARFGQNPPPMLIPTPKKV